MKNNMLMITALTTFTLASSASAMSTDEPANPKYVQEAQALVKAYAGELMPTLKGAMKEGGPAKGMEVCHSKAPQIAQDLAQKSGWEITRVSLKPRGSMANPDAWETDVLKRFDKQRATGMSPKELAYAEQVEDNGQTKFRYMKAIGTKKVCLTCHGSKVSAPVKEALAKYYPNDKATGYKKGDIRGAFSFAKVVEE